MTASTETTEVTTRFGPLLVKSQDLPIAEALSKYGEWAQVEIDFLAQFIPSNGVVLDVGSHIGIHPRAFAALSADITVHAFEAQPELAELLHQNAARRPGQIHPHALAVGETQGHAYIGKLPTDGNSIRVGKQFTCLATRQMSQSLSMH